MTEATNFEQDMNNQNERNSGPDNGPGTGTRKSRRGFAAMDPAKQREIARQGGKAAHQLGVAHEWSSQEAREAGRKGGQNSRGGGRSKNSTREDNIM